MPTVHGTIVDLGLGQIWRRHDTGAVIAVAGGTAIGSAEPAHDGSFTIELPVGTRGPVEFRAAIVGAAPAVLEVIDDDDVEVHILVNRADGNFA